MKINNQELLKLKQEALHMRKRIKNSIQHKEAFDNVSKIERYIKYLNSLIANNNYVQKLESDKKLNNTKTKQ
jgi:hypothetical protein